MGKIKNWLKTMESDFETIYQNNDNGIMIFIVKNPGVYEVWITDISHKNNGGELLASYKNKEDAKDFAIKFMRGNP